MLREVKDIYHIEIPVYHPKQRYGVEIDETSIGIAKFRIDNKDYFWVRVGKDDKFVYRLNVASIKAYIKSNPKAIESIKSLKIYIIPIQKFGKSLKLYRRYSIQEYEDLRLENQDLRLNGSPTKYDS